MLWVCFGGGAGGVVVVLLELHSGSDNLSRSTGVLSGGLGKEGSVREL